MIFCYVLFAVGWIVGTIALIAEFRRAGLSHEIHIDLAVKLVLLSPFIWLIFGIWILGFRVGEYVWRKNSQPPPPKGRGL